MYFAPPLKDFPWKWVSALSAKETIMMGLPGWERSLKIFQPSGYNTRTWQIDGESHKQTLGDSKTVLSHSITRKKILT